jgi:hypothetical protein
MTLEAFDFFKTYEQNADLIERNVFGVLILIDGEWVPTEITEDDFGKYKHIFRDPEDADSNILFDAAKQITNFGRPAWPLVVEIV